MTKLCRGMIGEFPNEFQVTGNIETGEWIAESDGVVATSHHTFTDQCSGWEGDSDANLKLAKSLEYAVSLIFEWRTKAHWEDMGYEAQDIARQFGWQE
jgi:hypothetical protein